jgi:hypothetical protein
MSKLKKVKAKKEDVKTSLSKSLDYCNSHHESAQAIFEEIVDNQITSDSKIINPEQRARDMKALFPILLQQEHETRIPSISMTADELPECSSDFRQFLELWFTRWVDKFTKEWKSLPSEGEAKPKKAVTDRALVRLVSSSGHAGDIEEAERWAAHHNLYMCAENIGGNLLEQYIAEHISPYGWIWCRGKILTAVDFCNESCTCMFQVKNKTNTENSSSKGYRESVGVEVWCRMRESRKNGEIVTYWPELIKIIQAGAPAGVDVPDDIMSEDDYLIFVKNVAEKTPISLPTRKTRSYCFVTQEKKCSTMISGQGVSAPRPSISTSRMMAQPSRVSLLRAAATATSRPSASWSRVSLPTGLPACSKATPVAPVPPLAPTS